MTLRVNARFERLSPENVLKKTFHVKFVAHPQTALKTDKEYLTASWNLAVMHCSQSDRLKNSQWTHAK